LPHWLSGSVPAVKGLQVPSLPVWLHDTHTPVHPVLQHTPPVQNPLAQSAALVHVFPFEVLHAPVVSHAWSPEQLPAIWVPGAANTQVPALPATLHDLHAPEHEAESQQTPSTQLPEAHCAAVAAVQPVPLPQPVTVYSQVSSMA
jgi:hypothetical protein